MGDTGPVGHDELWRDVLAGTHPSIRVGRRLFKRLPGEPRCKLCAAPLGGAASPVMRLMGKRAWPKNPKYCGSCFGVLSEHHGGAEIECSLMFADVRGSTTMAEDTPPSEIYTLMDRFFDAAARVLVEHDAIVDRFVGDQAIGIFVPALAGPDHAARAIQAAQAVLVATGHGAVSPWVPIGVGVASGVAFVGSVGSGSHVDLTALGDPVNVAARLSSVAAPGEVLVTLDAAIAAGLDVSGLKRHDLALKGKAVSTPVVVLSTPHGILMAAWLYPFGPGLDHAERRGDRSENLIAHGVDSILRASVAASFAPSSIDCGGAPAKSIRQVGDTSHGRRIWPRVTRGRYRLVGRTNCRPEARRLSGGAPGLCCCLRLAVTSRVPSCRKRT